MKTIKDSHGYDHNVIDETLAGFINHALWSDVESWAVLSLDPSKKRGMAVCVEIPSRKCYNEKEAVRNGIPSVPCAIGKPFPIKFTYGKWRDMNGNVLGQKIVDFCAYHYDINF